MRRSPDFSFPSELVPKFDQQKKCKKHDNIFNENDGYLKLCATHIIVHKENKETIYPRNVYYRETVGSCKCQQHYDGHELLLFHVGLGKMVCYFTLQNYLHSWVNSGITKYAFFNPNPAGGGHISPPVFQKIIAPEPNVGLTSDQAVNSS